jgi:hypothetical protein
MQAKVKSAPVIPLWPDCQSVWLGGSHARRAPIVVLAQDATVRGTEPAQHTSDFEPRPLDLKISRASPLTSWLPSRARVCAASALQCHARERAS